MSTPSNPAGIGALAHLRLKQVVRLRDDVVDRQRDLVPDVHQQRLRGGDFLVGDPRAADVHALRLEERVGHLAADEQVIDLRQQRVDERDLVRHLRPAHDRRAPAASGSAISPSMISSSFATSSPTARGLPAAFSAAGTADHAGVLVVVTGAEGVVDVHVAERGEFGGELGVVLLLARVEADVFEQQHVAGLQRRDRGRHVRPDDVARGLLHRHAEQFAELGGDLVHREVLALFGRGLLWPAEVAHRDHASRRRRAGA